MSKDIDFFKLQTHAVDVYHSDHEEIGHGTLSFGSGNWAHVAFNLTSLSKKFTDDKTWHVLKARTSDGHVFSLFECKTNGFAFYANYVIDGDVDSAQFKRIGIRYSEISAWFLKWHSIDGLVGEKLVWSKEFKPFFAKIKSGSEQFTVKSEYVGNLKKQGEDHALHEHIEFVFEHTNGKFDLPTSWNFITCLFSTDHAFHLASTQIKHSEIRWTFSTPPLPLKNTAGCLLDAGLQPGWQHPLFDLATPLPHQSCSDTIRGD